jgi:hypothetical protein
MPKIQDLELSLKRSTSKSWWFLSVLPSHYLDVLESEIGSIQALLRTFEDQALSDLTPQSRLETYDVDLSQLLISTERKRRLLLKQSSETYLWSASLHFEPWSKQAELELERFANSAQKAPLKYWVELSILNEKESEFSVFNCLLCPAELKVMTLLDSDLGRRIGDELDGQRPR